MLVHMTVWDTDGNVHEVALTMAEYETLMNQMPARDPEELTA